MNTLTFLSGYKAYIGFALIGIGFALEAAGVDAGLVTIVKGAGYALAGIGVAHKLQKNTDAVNVNTVKAKVNVGVPQEEAKVVVSKAVETVNDLPKSPPSAPSKLPFAVVAALLVLLLPNAVRAQSQARVSFCIGLFNRTPPQPRTDPAVLALMQQSLSQQAASAQQTQAMIQQQGATLNQILWYSQQCVAQHAAGGTGTTTAPAVAPAVAAGVCTCQGTGQIRSGAVSHPVTVIYPPANPVPNQILVPQNQPNQILVPQTTPNQVLIPQTQPNQPLQPQTVPNIILMPQPQPNQILVPAGGVPNQPLAPAGGAPNQPLAPGNGGQPIIPSLPPPVPPGATAPPVQVQPTQPLQPGGGTGQPLTPGTGGQPLIPASGSPAPLPGTTPGIMPYAPANYLPAQYVWRPAAQPARR